MPRGRNLSKTGFLLICISLLISLVYDPKNALGQEERVPPVAGAPDTAEEAAEAPQEPLPADPLQRGQILLRQGRLDEAERAFREVIQRSPERPEGHFFLGSVLLEKREFAAAIASFRKVLAIQPGHLFSQHYIGVARLREGKVDEAIKIFEGTLALQPAFYPAHLELGRIFERRGEIEEAVRSYQAVIQYGADVPQAEAAVQQARSRLEQTGDTPEKARQAQELFVTAQRHFDEGNIVAADAAYREILKLIPRNVPARFKLAQISLEKGNMFLAIQLLDSASRIDPEAWQVYLLLGQLYETSGRWNEAALSYFVVTRLVAEGPVHEEARIRIGSLRELLRERDLAERIRTDQPLREAREKFEEGLASLQKGDLEGAIRQITAAIEMNETNPFYFFNLGVAYLTGNQLVEATLAMQKAIELKEDYGPAHFFLGQIYTASGDAARDQGDLQSATGEYRKALAEFEQTRAMGADTWIIDEISQRIPPLNEQIGKFQQVLGYSAVGRVLIAQQQYDLALEMYEHAAELVPEDPVAYTQMGSVYERRGEPDKARQIYERAAEIIKQSPIPYLNLGQLYENEGRLTDATQAYEAARERAPGIAEPHVRLGQVYFLQERFEDSKTAYQKALEISPELSEPYLFLGQVYEGEDDNQARLDRLHPFSGSWSHTVFSYNNNFNASGANAVEEVSTTFFLSLNYVLFSTRSLHDMIPLPLNVPVNVNSGVTTFLRSGRLVNRDGASLSLDTAFLKQFDASASYAFNFSLTDESPISLSHSFSFLLGRAGEIPTRVATSLSYDMLQSLINANNDRVTLGTQLSFSQSIPAYGQLTLTYGFSADNTIRLDQSGQNHSFSFGYSSPLFGNFRVNAGIDYSFTNFDTPRLVSAGGGAQVIQTEERTDTTSFRLGGTYTLQNGLILAANYRHMINQSNLNIPRPPVDATQEELEQVRPTDNFSRDTISLTITKSF